MHCIVIVIGIVGRGVHTNRSRVATLGRRGELPAELGVFFREPLQLRGRVRLVMLVLTTFWLRIEYSIVIILLAFERRVESRRRRRGDQAFIIVLVLTLMGRIE